MSKSNEPLKYRISIKTLQGNFLNFFVDEFAFAEGYITFVDKEDGLRKWFPANNSEVYELL